MIPALVSPVFGKSVLSDSLQTQTYKIYLPIVMNPMIIIEYPSERPPCRWARGSGGFVGIPYKWGDNLQTPGSSW
jgi:hypothetical protein